LSLIVDKGFVGTPNSLGYSAFVECVTGRALADDAGAVLALERAVEMDRE